MRKIVVIAHDIRSTHNVGALFRLCDGVGVNKLYLTGYTPYPKKLIDKRLPHIWRKLDKQISKTALGAEKSVKWSYIDDVDDLINELQEHDFQVIALEQSAGSKKMSAYKPGEKVAILLGREVEGIDKELLKICDTVIEIPMLGKKESHNVITAASMALYHLRFAAKELA